ncbi:MAG: DUF5666 domain-containing protein [Terracidiphilus sp.]|jgi:uncharacterized protein DUF5666
MKVSCLATILLAGLCGAASANLFAQDAPGSQTQGPGGGGQRGGRGGLMGMGMGRGTVGTVTDATADHYTIKTELGDIYTVHFSVNTRIMKQPPGQPRRGQGQRDGGERTPPQPIKATDIKVGDVIAASGEVDANAKSVGAVFVMLIDPERAKEMRAMEANYGKTWLMGRVTAINEVKVNLEGGPDHAAHSFVADENTTFRKRRDPITLADVQVGDMVRVEGAVKDGAFVATNVAVMGPPPNGGPNRGNDNGPPQGQLPGPPQ